MLRVAVFGVWCATLVVLVSLGHSHQTADSQLYPQPEHIHTHEHNEEHTHDQVHDSIHTEVTQCSSESASSITSEFVRHKTSDECRAGGTTSQLQEPCGMAENSQHCAVAVDSGDSPETETQESRPQVATEPSHDSSLSSLPKSVPQQQPVTDDIKESRTSTRSDDWSNIEEGGAADLVSLPRLGSEQDAGGVRLGDQERSDQGMVSMPGDVEILHEVGDFDRFIKKQSVVIVYFYRQSKFNWP